MSNDLVGRGCIHEKQTERGGRIPWDVCPFCQIQALSEEIARLETGASEAMTSLYQQGDAALRRVDRLASALVDAEAGLQLAVADKCRCLGGFRCTYHVALDVVRAALNGEAVLAAVPSGKDET